KIRTQSPSVSTLLTPGRSASPATQARPPVGRTKVVSMPMVVDLPAPFGPSSPKNWPDPTDKSMPRTAGTSPRDDLYVLRKSSVRIANPAASVMTSTYVDEELVSTSVDTSGFHPTTT